MRKLVIAVLLACLLALSIGGAAFAGHGGKTTICHNTGSATNPVVVITVSDHAVAMHVTNHGDALFSGFDAAGNPICGGRGHNHEPV